MLTLEGVHAGYTAIPVLNGVSIRVGAGQFVAIVGPNGAGKTTVFRTISGTLRPSAGRITFDGQDLGEVRPDRRPHLGIAHVPEGRQVFASLTVFENLEMGAYTEAGRRAWKENLDAILGWFPVLAERRNQLAGTLSGGERQMLALGRALMSEPRLLMLDEPSLGLAPGVVEALYETLDRLHKEGLTLLLAEQSIPLALDIADYAYVLQTGRTVLEGRGADLEKNEQVQEIYLGIATQPGAGDAPQPS
jgi:branched-chain amino acid transport system ATP-binding protein